MVGATDDYGVLCAGDAVGRMRRIHILHLDGCPVAVGAFGILLQRCHEALALMRGVRRSFEGRKAGFVRFEPSVELIQRKAGILRTDDRLDFNILRFQWNSGLAGENQKFAQGLPAAEVDAGIRFGKTFVLGLAHDLRETAGGEGVFGKDPVQCAADDCLDGEDFVAGIGPGGDTLEHGQSRSDSGFVAEEHPVFLGGGMHGRIIHERNCKGAAIGTHDAEAFAKKPFVFAPDILAVRNIHKDAPAGSGLAHHLREIAFVAVSFYTQHLAGTVGDVVGRFPDEFRQG